MNAPKHIWEIGFLMPNGNIRYYRTHQPMTFEEAVMGAIDFKQHPSYKDGVLFSIEKVPS